jgi:hypothetical protein
MEFPSGGPEDGDNRPVAAFPVTEIIALDGFENGVVGRDQEKYRRFRTVLVDLI